IPQDCAGFGFVYKAHPAAHIEIRVGGCNAVDGPKDKQGVELFFAGALRAALESENRLDGKAFGAIIFLAANSLINA
ncbi:MAG: hypothetical protein AB1Z20_11140, partial [Desulfobacterales bacterium]